MLIENPIITGMYPDPSICRVGEDYYLVTSSFEFFPGVPIFHSKDLVNWQQIGHCITRPEQLHYGTGKLSSSGIYAPTIRYHNGVFYMITTNMNGNREDHGNFFMWTKDPAGSWSNAIFLDLEGIDPSLYFEDGRAYYTGTSSKGIYLCEIDLETGQVLSEPKVLWGGSGGAYPEGPHLYKKDGWYYLMISEGGTERCHMITMARSQQIDGPYEACPTNPLLTNRSLDLPIQAIGHADLVEDPAGNWWAICLGIRTLAYPQRHNLGRETMLVPVDWSGEWPVFGETGHVVSQFETDKVAVIQERPTHFADHFTESVLKMPWNTLYQPLPKHIKIDSGALIMHGSACHLSEAREQSWLGIRQKHFDSETRVTLHFPSKQDQEEAGLTIFLNERHHYELALKQAFNQRKLIFRRRIGQLWKVENEMSFEEETIDILLRSSKEEYRFYYLKDQKEIFFGSGEVQYLTTEVGGAFTGNYIALYATGNGVPAATPAQFTAFDYRGNNEYQVHQIE